MPIIVALIGLPLLFAIFTRLLKSEKALGLVVRVGGIVIIAATLLCVYLHFGNASAFTYDLSGYPIFKGLMLVVDVLIAAYVIYVGIKNKSYLVAVIAAAQILLFAWFELFAAGQTHGTTAILLDKLSLIMIIIIGIIGSLICLYAVPYMEQYHRHHKEFKDRRSMFFTVMMVFMSAMFGIVVSNDLTYLLFFWEITSLCSFLLIGYTKTPEATKNSFLALTINVFGGLCFTIGIVVLGLQYNTVSLTDLLTLDSSLPMVMAISFLLCTAGLTKAAQLPFSKWLLGAMVAPTPTSALLHSSTMVKAGVYLILRMSPMLGDNTVGVTITLVGGITFFATAVLALTQSDSKKVLAYSTISNLGLIVACAGINTPDAVWAAIMLIIFHAIAKSLLFLTVGSVEHQTGSRNIESMDGLLKISTVLSMFLVVGIAGMFIAPFGMLISKWAAMRAFLETNNTLLVLILAFGSTVTLFFWSKWMGKIIANTHRPAEKHKMAVGEKLPLYILAVLVVLVCGLHPLVSDYFIIPYISGAEMISYASPISGVATTLVLTMLCLVFIVPIILLPFYSKHRIKTGSVYLSGENTGDDKTYYGAMHKREDVELRNWYFPSILNEGKTLNASLLIGAVLVVGGFFLAIGGLFL